MLIFYFAGSDLLIRELPFIFDGSAKLKAKAQDNSKASLAPKVSLCIYLSYTMLSMHALILRYVKDYYFHVFKC